MTGPGLAAAALTGLAVLLLAGGPTRLPASLSPRRPGSLPGTSHAALVAGVVVVGLLVSTLTGRQLVLALLAGAVLLGVLRLVRRSRDAAAATRRAGGVLALCDALAAELVAGQPALAALERAAADWQELLPVVAASRLGADVPQVLRELALRPGAGELRVLAAAWQVAHESGCGLADSVSTAAAAIRERQATRRLVGSELAAAHATARLMAVLPFAVLLLGAGVGGDPVGFLVGTTPGLACLAAGLGLAYTGLVWLHHVADRVIVR